MIPSVGYDSPFQMSIPVVLPDTNKPGKWKLLYGNEDAPTCPRCASTNTKFCYYNNYSLSQPRYFCKGCRRYWTKGGTLRNVPVGGGFQKSRRRANNKSGRVNPYKNKNGRVPSDQNPDHEIGASPSPEGGSDVDLAVVFAKFLNGQSPSSTTKTMSSKSFNGDQESPSNEVNCVETTDASTDSWNWNISLDHDPFLEFCNEMDPTQKSDSLKVQISCQVPEKDQEKQHHQEFALQDLLNDEGLQDVLWSDDPATTTSPMMQLQDLVDSFSADDWSSLDLPGFQICSEP